MKFSLLPVQDNIHRIVVASMAKGLGIDGGLVLGGSDRIAQLKKTQMFNGASPPAPAALYAFTQAREIYARQWKKLQRNLDFIGSNLPEGIHYAKGFPAYYAENPDLYERLLKVGIVISSFSYPQAHDPLLNRIIVSSWHHEDDLQFLLNHLT